MDHSKHNPAPFLSNAGTSALGLILTLVLCVACGGSSNSDRDEAAENEPLGFGSPSLSPVLEADAGITRRIGPRGGSVVTEGADGARYELEIPPGALEAPVSIVITPAVRVDGLPYEGGLVQAVGFEPDGLEFAVPATLVITPAAPLPPGPIAGFAWSGEEDRFEVASSLPDANGNLRIRVDHFSGFGAGIPGPSQLDALAAELTRALQNRDLVIGLLAPECFLEGTPCTDEEKQQIIDDLYISVDRLLAVGTNGVVEAITAHENLVAWVEMQLILGLEDVRTEDAKQTNFENLQAVFESYSLPACTGEVTDWRDFVRIPEEIESRAASSGFYDEDQIEGLLFSLFSSCARIEADDVSFPETFTPDETELPLSFRTVIRVPGEEDIPIPAEVDLSFGPGTSGQTAHETDTQGRFTTEISREPTAPRVRVDARLQEPETRLLNLASFQAGDDQFVFESNDTSAAPCYVPSGDDRELCAISRSDAPAGTTVEFELFGPGEIDATSDILRTDPDSDFTVTCVTYTAPDGPVARDLAAEVTARYVFDAEAFRDTVEVYPHWKDVVLETDVGNGFVDTTNRTVSITGERPVPMRATVHEAGECQIDEPLPERGETVRIETPEQTLVATGCCASSISRLTNSAGRVDFQWRRNGSESSEFPIEVFVGPGESLVGASTTLQRLTLGVAIGFPDELEADLNEPLIIHVTDGTGTPFEGAYVEITAFGGSVGNPSGLTDEDGRFETTARRFEREVLELEVTVALAQGEAPMATANLDVNAPANEFGVVLVRRVHDAIASVPGSPPVRRNGTPGPGFFEFLAGIEVGDSRATSVLRSNAEPGFLEETGANLRMNIRTALFIAGDGEVERNESQIFFDVIDEEIEYDFTVTLLPFGNPTFTIRLRNLTTGAIVQECVTGGSCPDNASVDREGTLQPGSYVFEASFGAGSGGGDFFAAVAVGHFDVIIE